jgi:3-hydroxyacyl-[acyl-carrier-protein] dehydratase
MVSVVVMCHNHCGGKVESAFSFTPRLFRPNRTTTRPGLRLWTYSRAGILGGLDFPTQSHFAQADYPSEGPMRFSLIDRIIELEPGVRITAIKSLTMAEEYLADHFPHFPVMPGVLMLEAMTQAGAWLVRASEDFAHSMVVLRQAANVKYVQFVEPGQTLTVTAEIIKSSDSEAKLKVYGTVSGRVIVSARLTLAVFNLADANPQHGPTDIATRKDLRSQFALLYQPQVETSATSN